VTEPQLAQQIHDDVARALEEDIGSGDITAALIPSQHTSHATIISREPGVLCGSDWANAVFKKLDSDCDLKWHYHDGDHIAANTLLCELSGNARALLSGERAALNFLQTLSGTATLAKKYAEAIAGSTATILDTRKTIPGLRAAQKYAVKCGGGENHRMGLYDAYLIKENHIHAAGSIQSAVAQARQNHADKKIEVEVESMDELQQAIDAQADIVLLDNFSLDDLRQAVSLTAQRAKLEASGNVSLNTVNAIAATGVDYISSGELTKHLHCLDLSMRFK